MLLYRRRSFQSSWNKRKAMVHCFCILNLTQSILHFSGLSLSLVIIHGMSWKIHTAPALLGILFCILDSPATSHTIYVCMSRLRVLSSEKFLKESCIYLIRVLFWVSSSTISFNRFSVSCLMAQTVCWLVIGGFFSTNADAENETPAYSKCIVRWFDILFCRPY